MERMFKKKKWEQFIIFKNGENSNYPQHELQVPSEKDALKKTIPAPGNRGHVSQLGCSKD